MYDNNHLKPLIEEFHDLCRRHDQLAGSIENNAARTVFEQCDIGLQETKQRLRQSLQSLQREDSRDIDYSLRVFRQALQHFKDLLQAAEEKVHHTRPVPPFLY